MQKGQHARTRIPHSALCDEMFYQFGILGVCSGVQGRQAFAFILIPDWRALVENFLDGSEGFACDNRINKMLSKDCQGVHSAVIGHGGRKQVT